MKWYTLLGAAVLLFLGVAILVMTSVYLTIPKYQTKATTNTEAALVWRDIGHFHNQDFSGEFYFAKSSLTYYPKNRAAIVVKILSDDGKTAVYYEFEADCSVNTFVVAQLFMRPDGNVIRGNTSPEQPIIINTPPWYFERAICPT